MYLTNGSYKTQKSNIALNFYWADQAGIAKQSLKKDPVRG